ncbi:protein sip5 [Anaeramoeba flamelloides]|uniref:Protein sip5 n=1 Tax=Anaeramoeba flamelloides TaxID=1746091 RepID=A0ABQ8XGH0_9EUKA|nr:protein sip5 [Anaeramoeba flamelloides]
MNKQKLLKYIDTCRLKYTKPTYEIYEEISWDCGFVKKQILQKKLSPLFEPSGNSTKFSNCVCSICYYYFPILNQTHCCNKGICTECYLQIQPKKQATSKDLCPFCRKNSFKIKYNLREARSTNHKKKTKKQQKTKEKMKLARKKERELFENNTQKIKEKLLKQKESELKKGLYDEELNKIREKEKQREKNKSIFQSQKQNQEKIDQENNEIREKNKLENESISERIQRLMSSIDELSNEERIELDELMLQQVLRLSLEQN